jgi:transcriptional regulator with XRE-family HTH domain
MKTWNHLLADARKSVRLTQAELAAKGGISTDTVKAYEVGRRRPRPTTLDRLLTVLNVDWRSRNDILTSAGFLPGPLWPGGRTSAGRYLTVEEARATVALRPWPSLVLNERLEVLATNDAGFRILQVEPERLLHPVERSLLTMVTESDVGRQLVNWDDAVSAMIALFKAHVDRVESLNEPSSYFSAVLARVYEGDAVLVRRFLELWESTPGFYPQKVAWTYPLAWDIPEIGLITFRGVVNSVNDVLCLDIDDWIPADPESFRRLNSLLSASEI